MIASKFLTRLHGKCHPRRQLLRRPNNRTITQPSLQHQQQQRSIYQQQDHFPRTFDNQQQQSQQSQHDTRQGAPRKNALEQYNVLEYDPGRIAITGYTDRGFDIGAVRIFGSLIATERDFFCWNVQSMEQISIESLSFFEYLNPTPQILIIGTGEHYQRIDREIRDHFRSVGIVIEEMTTVNALSTFNVLNQENRSVACALLSMKPVDVTELTPENHPALFMEIEEMAKTDPQFARMVAQKRGGFT